MLQDCMWCRAGGSFGTYNIRYNRSWKNTDRGQNIEVNYMEKLVETYPDAVREGVTIKTDFLLDAHEFIAEVCRAKL